MPWRAKSPKRARRSASSRSPGMVSRPTRSPTWLRPLTNSSTGRWPKNWQVKRPRPEQSRGYIPPADERLARLRGEDTPPYLKELYTIGPFDMPEDPYFTGPAAWPLLRPQSVAGGPAGPRPALEADRGGLEGVARSRAVLCRALDLPPNFFDDKDRQAHQPVAHHALSAARDPPMPGQLRAGAHSDLGMMTLLYSDNGPRRA